MVKTDIAIDRPVGLTAMSKKKRIVKRAYDSNYYLLIGGEMVDAVEDCLIMERDLAFKR